MDEESEQDADEGGVGDEFDLADGVEFPKPESNEDESDSEWCNAFICCCCLRSC